MNLFIKYANYHFFLIGAFFIVYIICSILTIKKPQKYKTGSIVMGVVGVACIIVFSLITNTVIHEKAVRMINEEYFGYQTKDYIYDMAYGNHSDAEFKRMQDNFETALDLIWRNEYKGQEYETWYEACEAFLNDNPGYKDDSESEVKGVYYYTIMLLFIIDGVLFFIFMIPVKTAHKNKHPAIKSIGAITVVFGNTIIIWIAMLIWANSPSSAAKQQNIDTSDKLKKLNEMLSEGLITKQEFDAKKKELLDKM